MAPVIEIEGLRKTYRRFRKPPTVALDGLDLEVPEGGVFGFLGPNGAGKTTTIRCPRSGLGLRGEGPSPRQRRSARSLTRDPTRRIDRGGALIVAFLSGALAVAAALRGSTELTQGWWRDITTTSLRIAVIASVAALIGGAVAAVGRHTSAALGVVFVYTAVLEGLIRAFRPLWSPWLLGDNIVSFVAWQTTEFGVPSGSYVLSPGRAAFVIAAYTIVALALGALFVRIRDVQ